MCTQRRKTAGIRVVHGSTQVHLDPGPGALVHSIYAGLTPMRLDGVVVSHCHPDHYTDAEVLVEAMTSGTTRRHGTLAASKSVLQGSDGIDPSVSRYHQGLPEDIETLVHGSKFSIGEIHFSAFKAIHGDSDAVSLRFGVDGVGDVGYTSDTELYEGYAEHFKGVQILIVCTIWPRNSPLLGHLCTDDAFSLIEEVKPSCAVTTHYGVKVLNADPGKEAAWLEEETGIPVIAAADGMRLEMSKQIIVYGPRKVDTPRIIKS
jgi:phosphoribosyl 1,2-cyclic phosphodiesterase